MIIAVCTAPRHGTWWAYRHNGCRCPESVEADRRYRAKGHGVHRYVRGHARAGLGPKGAEPDPIAVERAVAGDRTVPLTPPERAAAIDQLDRHGYSAAAIAVRLGITARTVQRRRAARRAADAPAVPH